MYAQSIDVFPTAPSPTITNLIGIDSSIVLYSFINRVYVC